ncbi:MAG: fibronectin type III domain-containing protein [Candidatus Aenigmarchaeota archaeon]|nr:fibronectin type III domain-containing protein [Candidatus Aenigmarchaeota archaeon]
MRNIKNRKHAGLLLITLIALFVLVLHFTSALTIQRAANPATNITENSAIITWLTDTPATSIVQFGTTRDTTEIAEDQTLVVSHNTMLSNLLPRTTYFYKFKTVDSTGNTREDDRNGALFQFTTTQPSDRTPPSITNVQILDRQDQSTTIGWVTNEPATSKVFFGETTPAQQQSTAGLTTEHAVTIQTTNGATYKYVINSCDTSINCANSTLQGFIAGMPAEAPPLTIDIPPNNKDSLLTLNGTTRPFAKISAFVNNEKSRTVIADEKGRFVLKDILLPAEEADIRIEATDQAGTTQKTGHTKIDRTPPRIILKNVSAVVTQPQLLLSGETNKSVSIEFTVQNIQDQIPPQQVINLRIMRTDKNRAELSWDASTETDFKEYLVLRNGERIAKTTSTSFADNTAPPQTNIYEIITADMSCNLGAPSNSASAVITGEDMPQPETPVLECEQPTGGLQTGEGQFSIPITLNPGLNAIKLVAKDTAGHVVEVNTAVTFDTGPPQILEDNLAALTPSYMPEVIISGRVSEQATILVYINSETKVETKVVTSPDGTFEAPVVLRRDLKIRETPQTQLDLGEGFENTIILEAIDQAGLKSRTQPKKVVFAMCGFGSNFDIRLTKPQPSMLIPRLILQQIQEVSLLVNATYKGRFDVDIQDVSVNPVIVSEEFANRFDNKIVSPSPFLKEIVSPKQVLGLAKLKFTGVPEDVPSEQNATMLQKEEAISNHRLAFTPNISTGVQSVGKTKSVPFAELGAGCLVPGLGCMKFLVELEIKYQERIPKPLQRDPRTNLILPQEFELRDGTEKKCVPIEVSIDKRPPSDKIPKGWLKSSIKVIDSVIDLFDAVLKPLTIIGQYTTYACLGTNAFVFMETAGELWSCEGSAWAAKISGWIGKVSGEAAIGGSSPEFDVSAARAGLCENVYSEGSTELQACMACQEDVSDSLYQLYEVMQPICDRVACPSAPTLQTHIRDQSNQLEEITAPISPEKENEVSKWRVGGRLFKSKEGAPADCAFTSLPEKSEATRQAIELERSVPMRPVTDITEFGERIFGSQKIALTYEGLKKIFDQTNELEKEETVEGGITKKDCEKYTRPSHPACCGMSYKREWGTACGYSLPVAGTVYESFDELKESVCESAQAANRQEDKKQMDCGGIGSVFNAVAGFCEPGTGNPVVDPVPTRMRYRDSALPGGARTNEIYVLVLPNSEQYASFFAGTDTARTRYRVVRGYIVDRFRPAEQQLQTGETAIDVQANTQAVPENGADLTQHFFIETQDQTGTETGTGPSQQTQQEQAKQAFVNALISVADDNPENRQRAEEAYEFIRSKIEFSGKTYIVKPADEGFLRSFQCGCLPALTAGIQQWRNIFGTFRTCLQTIMLTGDGSEGACQAMLSTYACDMLYDVVKCFANKWSSPGTGVRAQAEWTDFLGIITNTGARVQQRVQARYGTTHLWRTMFVEKKLVNSICAFAFTGTWNFDVTNLFNQQVETIPIASQGFYPKCTRRFVTYDPSTTPRGKTTWVYDLAFGLAAGSDLRYQIKLKCSKGFRCDAANGFRNGECDCNKLPNEIIEEISPECTPALPSGGQLDRGEILNTQCLHTIQGADTSGDVRYDTAILSWNYIDPRTNQPVEEPVECKIDLAGDDAPSECGFDPFRGMFRCSFGMGESAVRINSLETNYPRQTTEGTPVFGIGDNLNFTLQISQMMPAERARLNQNKKFILYQIKNQNNEIIAEQNERGRFSDRLILQTDGDYRRVLDREFEGVVTRERIAGQRAAPQAPRQLRIEGTRRVPTTGIQLLTTTDTRQPNYVFVFYRDRNNQLFDVYDGGENIGGADEPCRNGAAVSASGFRKLKCLASRQRLSTGVPIDLTYTSAVAGETSRTLKVHFTQAINTVNEIFATPTPQPEDLCTNPQPVQWTAIFKAVNADQNGHATTQTSLDPSTGEEAEKETNFNVICQQTSPK